MIGLLALPGLVFGSAYLLEDRSGVARAIIWMDADTDDQRRFPARLIEAPQRPTPLERASIELDDERVGGHPLEELLRSGAGRLHFDAAPAAQDPHGGHREQHGAADCEGRDPELGERQAARQGERRARPS